MERLKSLGITDVRAVAKRREGDSLIAQPDGCSIESYPTIQELPDDTSYFQVFCPLGMAKQINGDVVDGGAVLPPSLTVKSVATPLIVFISRDSATSSLTHQDENTSCLVCIYGHKTVFIAPPDVPESKDRWSKDQNTFLKFNPLEMETMDGHPGWRQVDLRPGMALVIPKMWWHCVYSTASSIGLSFDIPEHQVDWVAPAGATNESSAQAAAAAAVNLAPPEAPPEAAARAATLTPATNRWCNCNRGKCPTCRSSPAPSAAAAAGPPAKSRGTAGDTTEEGGADPAGAPTDLTGKVKCTGLTQNSQVDLAVWLKIPIVALQLTQILGQPCGFQVGGRALGLRALAAAFPAVEGAVLVGLYPIVTLEKQLLNMIGNLV